MCFEFITLITLEKEINNVGKAFIVKNDNYEVTKKIRISICQFYF